MLQCSVGGVNCSNPYWQDYQQSIFGQNDSNSQFVEEQINRIRMQAQELNITDRELLQFFSEQIQALLSIQANVSDGASSDKRLELQITRLEHIGNFPEPDDQLICFEPTVISNFKFKDFTVEADLRPLEQQLLHYGVLGDDATEDNATFWLANDKPSLFLMINLMSDVGTRSWTADASANLQKNPTEYDIKVSAFYQSKTK